MFSSVRSLNGNLSKWRTDKGTNMKRLFYAAASFNSDLSQWQTSKVMEKIFEGATALQQKQ